MTILVWITICTALVLLPLGNGATAAAASGSEANLCGEQDVPPAVGDENEGDPSFFRVVGVAADDVLSLRARSCAGSERIGAIPPNGRGIENLGCTRGLLFDEWERMSEFERTAAHDRRWCKVRYQGVEGWASLRFLAEDDVPERPDLPQEPAAASGSEANNCEDHGPDTFRVVGVAADDILSLRARPSADSERIGAIPPNGQGIENLCCQRGPSFDEWERMSESERTAAPNRRWCKIRYQGVEGWVAGRFLAE